MPAGGSDGALDADLLDPTVTNAGHLGGELLALQLNVDLGTSTVQVNGNSVSNFGNLLVCGTGTQFDGQSVGTVLSAANIAVGGGALPTDCTGQATCDYNSLDTLLQHLNVSFQQCSYTMLLGIGIPTCVLFSGSVVLFFREKTAYSLLQLFGAGCLVVVLLTHVSEALHLFPWMRWGLQHSVGHYVDFWSAVLGLTLFPVGYLLHALTMRRGTKYEEEQ